MVGSAAVHALLVVMLVVGSAFVSQKPKDIQVPIFDMFNVQVTDFETQGGGGGGGGVPQPVELPKPDPQPIAPQPKPEVKPEPKPVEPEPVKVQPKPEPVKVDPPKKETKAEPKPKETPKPKPIAKVPDKKVEKIPENKSQDAVKIEPPKKHTITPELSKVIKPDIEAEQKKAQQRREREEARKRAEAEAREEAARAFQRAVTDANAKAQAMAADRAAAFDRAANKLATEGTGASPISIPGPGAQAFVNYSQLVWSMYYQAWQAPQERANNQQVRVEIIIARDGTVKSAKITSRSGDSTVDRSVQRALDTVRRLPAFPVGATDEQRTFNLNFNLKPKRQLF